MYTCQGIDNATTIIRTTVDLESGCIEEALCQHGFKLLFVERMSCFIDGGRHVGIRP